MGSFETGALGEAARDPADQLTQDILRRYERADRELRDVLFGDGEYSIGCVKGEERRERVAATLRRMRQSLEALKAEIERLETEEAKAPHLPVARRSRKRAVRRPAPTSPKRVRRSRS